MAAPVHPLGLDIAAGSADSGSVGAVVFGMGRSGTSAVTGTLVSSGFYAGADSELMEASSGNPAGYWENLAVFPGRDCTLARDA
jgi:hypothetical protein